MSEAIDQASDEPFKIPGTPVTITELGSEFNWISLSATVKFLKGSKRSLNLKSHWTRCCLR